MTLLLDLPINKHFCDISGMYIDGDDSDDFHTNLHSEVSSDTCDQLADSVFDGLQILLHGRF